MLFSVLHELTKARIPAVGTWLRSRLPEEPTSVIRSNDGLGFHFTAAPEWAWTDGTVVKQLQLTEPADCCSALWFLCRAYDEQNETSDKVHARIAAEALLDVTADRAPFYWHKDALYTDTGRRDIPENIEGVETCSGKDKTALRVTPSPWLKDVLLTSLLERAT